MPLRVIGSPNATSMLVISRPAVVFEATSPTNRRTNEPAILGVAVGAYWTGLAAPRVPDRGARRRLIDPVGVTIDAVRRQVYVIAVPFLAVLWVLIAWKAGMFTPRPPERG